MALNHYWRKWSQTHSNPSNDVSLPHSGGDFSNSDQLVPTLLRIKDGADRADKSESDLHCRVDILNTSILLFLAAITQINSSPPT